MFCYIGSSGPGQSVTVDSPGYGKVTVEATAKRFLSGGLWDRN